MASKFPSSDDFDEQFLTCSICMRHFQDPRVLPCLHTFCRECLQEWATKLQPLECPTCRTQVSLPDQGVDGLRTNFYVNNLLDFAAAKKGAEPGVPCQVCKKNVEGSKSWCADCAILMCESCTLLHRNFPFSKDHEVTTEETLKAEGGISNFHRKRHCQKHKNQELVFYCESCNTLMCTACTVIDHRPGKDHNPVEITTVAQKKRESLQALLQDIDPRLKEIQASVKEVERKISNLAPCKEAAADQAKAYFRQLIDSLQKREKEILSQIDEQCRADGKALQTKKEAIEFELAGLTSAQTFCQQAVEHGSDVHILEVGDQVQTRVETLLAKRLDLESDWSEFQFVENTAVMDFVEDGKRLGIVRKKVKSKLVKKETQAGKYKPCYEEDACNAKIDPFAPDDMPAEKYPQWPEENACNAKIDPFAKDDMPKYLQWPEEDACNAIDPFAPDDMPKYPQWTEEDACNAIDQFAPDDMPKYPQWTEEDACKAIDQFAPDDLAAEKCSQWPEEDACNAIDQFAPDDMPAEKYLPWSEEDECSAMIEPFELDDMPAAAEMYIPCPEKDEDAVKCEPFVPDDLPAAAEDYAPEDAVKVVPFEPDDLPAAAEYIPYPEEDEDDVKVVPFKPDDLPVVNYIPCPEEAVAAVDIGPFERDDTRAENFTPWPEKDEDNVKTAPLEQVKTKYGRRRRHWKR